MKRQTLSLLVLSVFAVASLGRAEEYRINIQVNGEELAAFDLSIDGDTATAKVADVTERFDLKNQRWQHDESKQWVTLSQSEAWAKQSKEKSLTSTASIPEQLRPFILWSLNPTFETTATEDVLTLTSGQVDYEIAVEKSDIDLTNYYRYARLNAYKKAIIEGKIPPFAELQVLEELERRKLLPKTMEVSIPGIAGAPEFKIHVSNASNAANTNGGTGGSSP